jgi:predicted MFS family arabinose efflux permease
MKLAPLRNAQFRLLFAGRAISSIGDSLVPVALSFAVLDLTGSVTDLGIVFAAQTLPLVVFVLLGGVWADRLPRQYVMLASDGVRALAQGLTAVLLLSGSAHIWEIAALQALYGAAEAFFGPASVAVVPQTVGEGELQPANALLGLSGSLANVLGPALAGVIVATTGPGWGLAADAGTFVASAAFLAPMRPRALAEASEFAAVGTLAQLRAGWHAFRSRTWLWVTVAFFTVFLAFVFSPLQVLGPKVAKASLGGPGAWAAILVALGVGSIAGGLIGLRWRPRRPLLACFLIFLISGPALIVLLAARAPLAAIIAVALIDGSTGPIFNVFWFTAVQRDVPAAEQSRVTSWDYLGSLALQPVGLALTGPIAAVIGVSATLYGAGGLFVVLVLAVLAVPAVRNFELPAEPRTTGSESSDPA